MKVFITKHFFRFDILIVVRPFSLESMTRCAIANAVFQSGRNVGLSVRTANASSSPESVTAFQTARAAKMSHAKADG